MFNFIKKFFFREKTNELGIQTGDRFYSEYFQSEGTVVRFISDDHWYFVLDKGLSGTLRAQALPNELRWIIRGGKNETDR